MGREQGQGPRWAQAATTPVKAIREQTQGPPGDTSCSRYYKEWKNCQAEPRQFQTERDNEKVVGSRSGCDVAVDNWTVVYTKGGDDEVMIV